MWPCNCGLLYYSTQYDVWLQSGGTPEYCPTPHHTDADTHTSKYTSEIKWTQCKTEWMRIQRGFVCVCMCVWKTERGKGLSLYLHVNSQNVTVRCCGDDKWHSRIAWACLPSISGEERGWWSAWSTWERERERACKWFLHLQQQNTEQGQERRHREVTFSLPSPGDC